MKNNNLLIIIIVALVVGGGAFFGGMKYQESKQTNFSRQFAYGQGRMNSNFQARGRMDIRQVAGEILSQDDKSITVKLQDGSTKIVLLSSTTTYNKAAEGSKNGLKVGGRVGVFGAENADGSVTAQNIQLNPTFRGITGTPKQQ